MKKQIIGTQDVPSFQSTDSLIIRFNSFLNYFLPEDCKVKSKSDFYYASAIASTCTALIFPPLIIATIYCVIKAKKGY